MEVVTIKGKIKIFTISTLLILAVVSGIAYMVYANGTVNGTSATDSASCFYGNQYGNDMRPFFKHREFGGKCGGLGPLVVSEEYKEKVLNITQRDSDVQALLAQGYNISGIRPIISTIIEADGTVAMKAKTAVIFLQKDTTGKALVWVDVEQAKVTRIEILTVTVIDKTQ